MEIEVYDFGMRLRKLREGKKLSQPQLAKMLNLTRSAISSYENNLSLPSADALMGLARIFRVSTDYLLGIENQRTIAIKGWTENQLALINTFLDFLDECKT